MDLLTVGDAFEDVIFSGLPHLPQLGEVLRVDTLTRHPGGGAVLTAIAAARLGLRVDVVSAVSDETQRRLRERGVRVVNLRRQWERGAITVALSTKHDRAFVTFEGVNRALEPRLLQALRKIRRLPRHAHFALIPRRCQSWLPVVEHLRTRGVTTSWDFGWDDELADDPALGRLTRAVDWVFLNEKETALYAGVTSERAARKHWRQHARCAVIKLGKRGALALARSADVRAKPLRVEAVDTTGAGDAFNAGFLAAMIAGASVGDALRLGNYMGACSTRAVGGVDGLPQTDRLPRWAQRLLASVVSGVAV